MNAKKLMGFLLSIVIFTQMFMISHAEDLPVISLQDTVRGTTPAFLGFNIGITSTKGLEDNTYYGSKDVYGTPAFWFYNTGMNMMRSWGGAMYDEGVINSYRTTNDTTPDGDGVCSEEDFEKARNEVIKSPLNNKYTNINKFDMTKAEAMKELKSTGIESVYIMRFKLGTPYGFPTYMGGTLENGFDCGLKKWEYKWEWWEYCFGMAYQFARIAGVTHFEIGNEPEWQQMGGLTPDEQITAIKIGSDAIQAAVKAAIGKEAYIMACGTNPFEPRTNCDYIKAMMDNVSEELKAISIHAYKNRLEAVKTGLEKSDPKDVIITETGAGGKDDPVGLDMAGTMFKWYDMANSRLKGILIYTTSGGGDVHKIFDDPKDAPGVFIPRPVYYGIRMMFRAGGYEKKIYQATSTDSSILPLITKDNEKTYITLNNTSTTAKSYTIQIPQWINGSIQNVMLFDGNTYLDEEWGGVSSNKSTITVNAQPGKSFLQIVIGNTPITPIPAKYDQNKIKMGHLGQMYLPSDFGNLVESYKDDFTNSQIIEPADSEKWVPKGYSSSKVQKFVKGSKYFDRMYIYDNPGAGVSQASVLWHKDQVHMKDGQNIIFETDLGFEESFGDTYAGVMFRDNNGNILGVRTLQGVNGAIEIVKMESPYSPEDFFTINDERKIWSEKIPINNENTIKLTLNHKKIRVELWGDKRGKLLDSMDIDHDLDLSGYGRFAIAKNRNGSAPIWVDNMSIKGSRVTHEPAGDTVIQSVYGSDCSVELTWRKSENANGYTVKYGTASGNYTYTFDAGNVTKFRVNGLTNGQPYFFTVQAHNDKNYSNPSEEKSGTPVAAISVPLAPSLKNLYSVTDTFYMHEDPQFTRTTLIQWNKVNNVKGYNIKYSRVSGDYSSPANSKTIFVENTDSYNITGLDYGTKYYFVVTAVNSLGESLPSNEMSTTVERPRIPYFPKAAFTFTQLDDTTVRVSWSAAEDDVKVEKYIVFFQTGAPVAIVDGNTLECILKDVIYDNSRVFITAVDGDNNWSAEITKSFATANISPPTWPQDSRLTAVVVKKDSVSLSWTPAVDGFAVTQYRVFLNGELLTTISGESYTVTNLEPSTEYLLKVEAGDASNNWSTRGPELKIKTPEK